MIQLIVNGQPQLVPISPQMQSGEQRRSRTLNITELLQHMDLQGKRIAVERNGEIVPRSEFEQQILTDGDRLEIVVAVGGG